MSDRKTVAEMLNSASSDSDSECKVCCEVLGHMCDGGSCGRWPSVLATMVERELEAARGEGSMKAVKAKWGELGWPMPKHGDTLAEYAGRCFLPLPKYPDGEPVLPGSACAYGEVSVVEVSLSDDGLRSWMVTAQGGESMVGSHGESVPCGVAVEGKPVAPGDALYLGQSPATVSELVNDGKSLECIVSLPTGRSKYMVVLPEELSWERHEEPDTMERIRADAGKVPSTYWRCFGADCCDCPAKVSGKTPRKRFAVSTCEGAMRLDLIRRTEEVCVR